MKRLLYFTFLKPNKLEEYKAFAAEITGSKQEEYKALMKRFGLRTAKVWHGKLSDKEYIMILHDAENDAIEKMATWSSSKHPFDLWFGEQLANCYETSPELAELVFEFDATD